MSGSGEGYGRRELLRAGGLAAAGLGLAACGVSTARSSSRAAQQAAAERFWRRQRPHGHVNFANWPGYIDSRSLREFTAATGTTVRYAPVILDDAAWFGRVHAALEAGRPIGYDLMVDTNGFVFDELMELHDVMPLDQRMLVNFYKYAGYRFRHRSYDPGNVHSVPWAAGSTGIAWNPRYISKPVTSIEELWNPAYKGRVGMMVNVLETGNFGLIKAGVNPETSTPSDWRRAASALLQQRDDGLVRGYYDASYIDHLRSGDLWITMAWQGDIFQDNLAGGELRYVVPSEGGTLWIDNMMIPRTAQNPVDAMKLMDWYYHPKIAAQLTAAIGYISPVPSVRPIIAAAAKRATGDARRILTAVAGSPLIWPAPADFDRLYYYVNVSGQLKVEYQSIFQPIVSA